MEHHYSRPHLTELRINIVGEDEGEESKVVPSSARYDELDANFPLIVFHQWLQKFS